MIGKSLFVGNQIEWTALDPEKDAEELSLWTRDLQFSGRLFEKPARPYAVFEVKKKLKEDLKAADEKRNAYFFAIRKKGGSELVCLLRFGWLQPTQQVARLFLDFTSAQTMQDYGQEVLLMALRYGFMELSLHRIWLEVSGHRIEEIQLFEEAGFLRETQRREASFFDGRYYDQMVYSILKPEWKKLQEQAVAEIQQVEVTA
jgi:RimJ/RimL family protein N-acetyltransferase